MVDLGRIEFRNARESGVELAQLGSGTFDHMGFFGINGDASAVDLNSFQDTTILVDSAGTPDPTLGPFGSSGFFTNTKNVGDPTTVELSGGGLGPGVVPIVNVNIFDTANLLTEPEFSQQSSGTLLIQYFASGVSEVSTFNAKLYAFDNTATILTPAPDVSIQGFEINGSGIWKSAAFSGVWSTMSNQADALEFADHSVANGYVARNRHIWVAAITARADSIGILDDFDFAFEIQFA